MDKKVVIIILGIVLATVILSSSWLIPTGQFLLGTTANQTPRMGIIIPLTGTSAGWGINDKQGSELAFEELSKTNIPRFELIYENSNGEEASAVTAAQKLISVDKVDILYTAFTGPGVAVSPIANNSKVLHLYEAASTKPATLFPNNSLKIGYYLYEEDCKLLGKVANDHNFQSIAFIGAQKDFSSECLKGFSSQFTKEIHSFDFSPSKENFRTILSKVKENKVSAIVVTGYNYDFIQLYKSMKELNVSIPILCAGAEDCLTSEDQMPKELIYFTADVSQEFTNKYLKRYPDSKPRDIMIAATAYDLVMLVNEALEKCDSKDTLCLMNSIKSSQIPLSIKHKGFIENKLVLDAKLVTLS